VSQCTRRTTYNLEEEKTISVGSGMVQTGCFERAYIRGPETQNDKEYIPIVEMELIYSGRAGNVLNITYREHNFRVTSAGLSQGSPRPAFTQQVQYDLSTSDIIVFQGWVIKVLDANNQTIRFKVEKEPPLVDWPY